MSQDEGRVVREEIDFQTASDEDVYARIVSLERKYGCGYSEFLTRGDFDHRPSEEWLDELFWRVLEEELADRIAARFPVVALPIRVPQEA